MISTRFCRSDEIAGLGRLDATTTHDTKRSEDVRARINVLSEISAEWKQRLDHWAGLNFKYRERIAGQFAPDRNEEYFIYQTLIGAWPLDPEAKETFLARIQEHLIKATREAMVHTRWTRPNQPHEDALKQFAERILAAENSEFLEDFRAFQKRVGYFGMINALSQTLMKITSPGVPDFYQGSELWDLRLVDPDNRGQIDYLRREAALKLISDADSGESLRRLVENWQDGKVKLHLIRKALGFRRDHADLFHDGDFIPLQVTGCHARNVVAFLRRKGDAAALVVCPRWVSEVVDDDSKSLDWCDTRVALPADVAESWTSVLSRSQVKSARQDGARTLAVSDLLRDFPVALFEAIS